MQNNGGERVKKDEGRGTERDGGGMMMEEDE